MQPASDAAALKLETRRDMYSSTLLCLSAAEQSSMLKVPSPSSLVARKGRKEEKEFKKKKRI
jgi:hypothetical protein